MGIPCADCFSKSPVIRAIQGASILILTPMVCVTFSMEAFRSQTGGKYSDLTDNELIRGVVWAVITGLVNLPSTAFFFLKGLKRVRQYTAGEMSFVEKVSSAVGVLLSSFVVFGGISFSLQGLRADLGRAAYPFVGAYATYTFATRLFGAGDFIAGSYHFIGTVKKLLSSKKARQIASIIWDVMAHMSKMCTVYDGSKPIQDNLKRFFNKLSESRTPRWDLECIESCVVMPALTAIAVAYATGMLPILMTMVANGLPQFLSGIATEAAWIGGLTQQLLFWRLAVSFFPTLRQFFDAFKFGLPLVKATAIFSAVMGAGYISGGGIAAYVLSNPLSKLVTGGLLAEGGLYASYWNAMIGPCFSTIAAVLAGCMANGATAIALGTLFFLPGNVADKVWEKLYELFDKVAEEKRGDEEQPLLDSGMNEVFEVRDRWRNNAPRCGLFSGKRKKAEPEPPPLSDSGYGAGDFGRLAIN